jgi:ABC-type Fe3+ transport system permease subunit
VNILPVTGVSAGSTGNITHAMATLLYLGLVLLGLSYGARLELRTRLRRQKTLPRLLWKPGSVASVTQASAAISIFWFRLFPVLEIIAPIMTLVWFVSSVQPSAEPTPAASNAGSEVTFWGAFTVIGTVLFYLVGAQLLTRTLKRGFWCQKH